MIILNINKRGSIKLPKEVIEHLNYAEHIQVRLNPHGITLSPIRIESAIGARSIPEPPEKKPQLPLFPAVPPSPQKA